jgi:hypothetical protein
MPELRRQQCSPAGRWTVSASARFIWVDFGWWPQPDTGIRKLLSWNVATKELTFWPIGREAPVVLAVISDEDEVRQRLEGWADHNNSEDGLAWLAQRLDGCR